MSAKNIFLDTNILVYAQDKSSPDKQQTALNVIEKVSKNDRLFISTQVLQEFSSVAIKKLGLSLPEINSLIDEFSKISVVEIIPNIIKEAVEIHFIYKYSFYDSLIIAAAKSAGCSEIYTEDLSNNQMVYNIKLINPFK